jgi:hypothetical protein
MTPTPGSEWFIAIDKFRGLFESADRGTVFGGPGPVSPLPNALGGDRKQWPLLAAPAKSKEGFFALLEAKAHFLMLPKTIVRTLKETWRTQISESVAPGAAADTLTDETPRQAEMRIPGSTDSLAKVGYDLGRVNTSLVEDYVMLARIYHEMTHTWIWLAEFYDDEMQNLANNGYVAYLSAKDGNGNDLEGRIAFSEAAAYYVADRILRWCKSLHDLDVLMRTKPEDPNDVLTSVQGMVEYYEKTDETYGVVMDKKIASPPLSKQLRDAINKKILDGRPLTKPFAETPLAGLRNWLSHP